jgi:hypothetical protein
MSRCYIALTVGGCSLSELCSTRFIPHLSIPVSLADAGAGIRLLRASDFAVDRQGVDSLMPAISLNATVPI